MDSQLHEPVGTNYYRNGRNWYHFLHTNMATAVNGRTMGIPTLLIITGLYLGYSRCGSYTQKCAIFTILGWYWHFDILYLYLL